MRLPDHGRQGGFTLVAERGLMMIKRCLPISHLLTTPSEIGRELVEKAEVLEFRLPEVPSWLEPQWSGKRRVFHWGLGSVMDDFADAFQAEDLGPFLARIQADLFSFDLGPACGKNLNILPLSPTLSPGDILDRSRRAIDFVKLAYDGPLAVENYNYYPTGMYEHICRPDFIARFLDETGVDLLLDLAHAVVSAANMNLDPKAYLLELPLDRVVCLHISKPYLHPSMAADAHDEPGDDEYDLLSFVLQHLPADRPILTAVEYYRDLTLVKAAYERLDRLVDLPVASAASPGNPRRRPMTASERLARKNAFDGSLVMGVSRFNRSTGRDRHRSSAQSSLVDPDTGLLKKSLARYRSCPLCGHDDGHPLFVKDGFSHGRCPDCGLVYVTPVLTEEAATAYYREEASWTKVLESGPQVELDRLKYEYGLDLAEPYLAGKTLLDIGAGTGLFVRVAHERNYHPVALELHRENVERLRNDGYQVIDRPLEAADIPDQSFDLVTLWEVLEHIVDPKPLLSRVHQLLKTNGLLFILVPNGESLATRLLHEKSGVFGGHSHVNFFNHHTLTRMLRETGFQPVETETIITELGTINNHLGFQDPYLGQADTQMDFLTPKAIHDRLLGSKLLMIARPITDKGIESLGSS